MIKRLGELPVTVQGEAAMSPDTLNMPGAQRSVAFCVHSWVQVKPYPADRHLLPWCTSTMYVDACHLPTRLMV